MQSTQMQKLIHKDIFTGEKWWWFVLLWYPAGDRDQAETEECK